eukprot:gene16926-35108_t
MSICSIEDIAEHTGRHPFWFQVYVMRDRDFIERLIDRAKAANCSALQLTLDLQILGQRHKDIKNGLSAPPKPTIANLINLATKPRWCLGMLGTKRRSFGNIVGHAKGVGDLSSLSSWTAEQFDPQLNWGDVEWIKKRWGGKLILKGIMDAEDARLAVNSGADALIVSNHGGRQLDGAPSSIAALPGIADAVPQMGGGIEVWMDGGIRSGQDVLKARALGAQGTLIGRSFLYGLGAYGEAGVTRALQIIQKELDITMAFCGHTNINTVDRSILLPGTYPVPLCGLFLFLGPPLNPAGRLWRIHPQTMSPIRESRPIPHNGRMSTRHPDSELMDLLDRVAAQDDSALKSLYDRTASQLFGLALRVVRNRDAAEDVLQEAFLTIWRSAGSYRASLSPPMAWMGLIVRSRALDALRKRTTDRADLMNELDDAMAQTLEGDAPNPMDAADASEQAFALHHCLGKLDHKQREVVSL